MKKALLFAAIMVLIALSAPAQTRGAMAENNPKVELYGGYSYMNVDGSDVVKRQHGHGWAGSISGNFNRNIGLVADIGGHYGHTDLPGIGTTVRAGLDYKIHEILFGPRFMHRTDEATAFFHTLFGAVDVRIPRGSEVLGASRFPFLSGQSRTEFAMGIGGGLDYNISKRVALRVFQLDYIPVRTEPTMHNVRGTVGFVLKLD